MLSNSSNPLRAHPDLLGLASDPLPAYVRMNAVLRITGLSRTTIYRRIASGQFPPPVHLGRRACGWRTAALREWIENPEAYVALRVQEEQGNKPKRKQCDE